MSVSGLCEICESREATDRCDRCGTIVCEVHLDEGLGVCTRCATEMQPGQGTDDDLADTDDPDVDTYRF